MARFLKLIGRMFVTMCPTLFGGVFNMLFVKTPLYQKLRRPIDGGRVWSDGQRIFGDNKTFAGFAGMTVGTLLSQVLWGLVLKITSQSKRSDLYVRHENRAGFNALAGGLFGFAYALLELPNSFAKRRFEIRPGKTEKGLVGKVFFVIDMIDSMFGVMLVLFFLTPMSILKYFGYIAFGGAVHFLANLAMFKTGIRKNF